MRQLIKVLKENEHTKAIPVIFLTGMSSEEIVYWIEFGSG